MSEDIKIEAVIPRIRYIADGKNSNFSYPFPIFRPEDISVYINSELIAGGYTVIGAGETSGGEICFDNIPQAGTNITLLRNLEIKRTTDFQESGAFRAKAINYELDYQVACIQQLNEQMSRSVLLPPYSATSHKSIELPQPQSGKALIWNEDATALINSQEDVNNISIAAQQAREAAQQASETAKQAASDAFSFRLEAKLAQENAEASVQETANLVASINPNNFLNKTQITNCITEIPQDIKLELNNGTVTLKAGSKVYIPKGKDSSGNNIFSEYTTSSDLSFGASSLGSAKRFVALLSGNIQIGAWSAFTSGTTVPSTGYFYHTSENRMYVNGEVVNLSLPLMFGDYVTQSGFSSIDQVFNGFGYVGNTVFALPGVKGLIPDGRNADGSLKNIETTVNKVAVYTFASNVYTPHNGRFLLNSSGGIFARVGSYDPVRNYITASDGVNILSGCSFAEGCLVEAGVIKTFNSKLPFRAVDTNDSTWARSKSFPDYTAAISISATGSYTAPCDGVLIGSVTAINGGSELTITIGGTNFICYQGNSGNDYNHTTQTYFPLKAGQGYTVDKLSGTTLRFFPFA